ncbi:hypothetical protein LH23_15890 [Cedecea neteri]|uniref:DUF2861 domain-containing protein n=1 Tax=Cedecea neteri TaxID=158822 RepID=A0AAN0VV03_9ENTR|nr:DUF2861 family protein [Cedecea neteri]AIR62080.1 hypothetical protein LH23_15890 [Cedecea neteri]
MKLPLLALLIVSSFSVGATLPQTPLEPVYHQLFNQRGDLANSQLIDVWPQLNSEAQRQAWKEALNAVVSRQCGKDLSTAVPEWLDDLTLTLMQRDMPLNRIYRITLSGNSPRHDINVALTLPDGKNALAAMPVQYEAEGEFRVESEEFTQPISEGVYLLRVSSGGQQWQQPLALQGIGGLTQIQLHDRAISLNAPQVSHACPKPWLEQTLLSRSDYNQIWWAKSDQLTLVPWPSKPADSVWATVAVVSAENRGSVAVKTEHRLAGPLATIKN